MTKLAKKLHAAGKKIVFTTGSFELITPGHCRFLAEAKALGDVVIVGVCSDRSITQVKGPDFPLLNQNARMEMLSYLKSVDHITLVDEGEPHTLLVLLSPDIYYVNQKEEVDEQARYLLKSQRGRLVVNKDLHPYKSARDLIEHIATIRFTEIIAGYLWSKGVDFGLNKVADFKPADYGEQKPNNPKAFNPRERIMGTDPDFHRDDAFPNFSSSEHSESRSEMQSSRLRSNKNFLYHSGESSVVRQGKGGRLQNPETGKKVVFVAGSYDLLHVGHARFIEKASKLGDTLVVGIPTDARIAAKKGYGRPIINQYSRAYVLASLDFVDYVYIFDQDTVLSALEKLKPAVFFTVKEDWNKGLKKSIEYKTVKKNKGRVVVSPRQSPFVSSSTMINKLALKKVKEIFSECMQDDKFKAMLLEGAPSGKK